MISSLAYPQETVRHSPELIATLRRHIVQLPMDIQLGNLLWAPRYGLLYVDTSWM